jgi:Uma2 family endonuclease
MTTQRRHGTSDPHRNGVTRRTRPIEYPESDGKPMAETDLHRDEMNRLIDTLKDHFAAEPDVYVSGNLFLYYEEGNPRASTAPDVFVVRGVPGGRRRIYKLWEEGPPPLFVIEVTSRKTRREDFGKKRELYARLGVPEYFMYDPEADYLRPALQGLVLQGGEYLPMTPAPDGSLPSETLNLWLRLEDGRLMLVDRATGEPLPSPRDRAAEATARAEAEAIARRAAEERVARLEALLQERGIQ